MCKWAFAFKVNLANLRCPAIEKSVFGLLLDLLLSGSCHISVFGAAQDLLRDKITANKVWLAQKIILDFLGYYLADTSFWIAVHVDPS